LFIISKILEYINSPCHNTKGVEKNEKKREKKQGENVEDHRYWYYGRFIDLARRSQCICNEEGKYARAVENEPLSLVMSHKIKQLIKVFFTWQQIWLFRRL